MFEKVKQDEDWKPSPSKHRTRSETDESMEIIDEREEVLPDRPTTK